MNQYDFNLILNLNISVEQVQIEKDYIENVVCNVGVEISNFDDFGNCCFVYQVGKDCEGYYLMYIIKVLGNFEIVIVSSLCLCDNVCCVLVVKDCLEWKIKKV